MALQRDFLLWSQKAQTRALSYFRLPLDAPELTEESISTSPKKHKHLIVRQQPGLLPVVLPLYQGQFPHAAQALVVSQVPRYAFRFNFSEGCCLSNCMLNGKTKIHFVVVHVGEFKRLFRGGLELFNPCPVGHFNKAWPNPPPPNHADF